jgi:hypothetical protein
MVEPIFGTSLLDVSEEKVAPRLKRLNFRQLGCEGETVDSPGILFAVSQEE